MKKPFNILFLPAFVILFMLASCSKETTSEAKNDESDLMKAAAYEEADLFLRGGDAFERVITKPLVKPDDCRFIVEGTIEFLKEGETVALIDFGNGKCDQWAAKTVRGKTTRISLKRLKQGGKFYKVIAEPIVKIEGCDYIVSGIIEFYSLKDDSWLATIDFGDGTCDEWATKTWDGGSKAFSMKDWGGKE
jgi:hypothetical protein